MRNIFRKLRVFLLCLVGKHEFEYMCSNYHTGSEWFKCKSCGKRRKK
jgi:hypothetical protein